MKIEYAQLSTMKEMEARVGPLIDQCEQKLSKFVKDNADVK